MTTTPSRESVGVIGPVQGLQFISRWQKPGDSVAMLTRAGKVEFFQMDSTGKGKFWRSKFAAN
jgi:hypothetical protein